MKIFLTFTLPIIALSGPSNSLIELASKGLSNAKKQGITKNNNMIIVDFSKPSDQKRLWVYDLKANRILLSTYVAHGKGSGLINAHKFSNKKQSYMSSIGFYQTLDNYNGKHGLSIRLNGLEYTNNKAITRGIVIHSANYTSDSYIKNNHRSGRSWGCFAVSANDEQKIIKLVKRNSLMLAYFPDKNWLKKSKLLNRIS